MTSRVEKRLTDLGLELPPDWTPRGQFLPFRKDGAIVYLSGQICEWGGEVTHTGPVLDTPDAIEIGRAAAYRVAQGIGRSLTRICWT